jgi:hypothetical protein
MSWLSTKIQGVLRAKDNQEAALHGMMGEVEREYLDKACDKRIRVNDDSGEGVLHGKRANTCRDPETNALKLTCTRKMAERRKEEAFSRGLFNQKVIEIGSNKALLVAYEAPLFRQHEGPGGNKCKLDLVALDSTALWAIEYKQRYSQVASARYGIVEALAYGFLMACHVRNSPEAMDRQVRACIEKRGPYPVQYKTLPDAIKFAVAAPWSFYREDTRTEKRRKLTDDLCRMSSRYADDVSKRVGLNLSFGGFLVVGSAETELKCVDYAGENVIPYFSPAISSVQVFGAIRDVRDFVNRN